MLLHKDKELFREAIISTAEELGVVVPIVEKDYYVTMILKLVRVFGDTKWFKSIRKRVLDKLVNTLQKKGYEDTPYQDPKY